jgi:PEP-CTERM motif
MVRRFAFAVALLLASVWPTFAAVIYEQAPGAGSNNETISSTLDNLGGLPGLTVADDWTLAADAVITDVDWWGEPNAGSEDFRFVFYAATGISQLPGTVLLSTGGTVSSTAVTTGSGFDPVFSYSADLTTPFLATAGTRYWLSVFNQASDASWLWLSANAPGNLARLGVNPVPPFNSTVDDRAFQLATVPEPTALVTLGLGLAGLGACRWRLRHHC